MLQKTLVNDLKIGMFVADLDRPWMDTPFMLQGFMLDSATQIEQVKRYCDWVLVDPLRSTGEEFERIKKAHAKVFTAKKRDLGNDPLVVITKKQAPQPSGSASETNTSITTSRSARPSDVVPTDRAAPMRSDEAPTKAHEFAVHTKTEVQDDLSATGRFRAERLLPPRENIHPVEKGSFWGTLSEGVKGLFSRKARDPNEIDFSKYDTPPNEENTRPDFVPETVLLTIYEDEQTVEEELGAANEAFVRTQDLLQRVINDIRTGNHLQLELVNQVMEDLVDSMVRNPDAMMWVARLREQDTLTYDHGLSVAINLVAFGRHLGFPKQDLSNLGVMGLMLDVGKIRVSRQLLEKEAVLTPEEFVAMKEHVRHSMNILHSTHNIHPSVLEGVAQHHERMDGSGYPNGIAGSRISIYGRMCGIADTYAAITKRRPYAEPVSPHEALQMLSNWSPKLFQLEMVEQFIQSIGVFPVGSLVELSTGEVAVIVTHNKQKRLKPKVLIVTEPDKKSRKHPSLRDLLYDVSEAPVYIRRGLPINAYGVDPAEFYLN